MFTIQDYETVTKVYVFLGPSNNHVLPYRALVTVEFVDITGAYGLGQELRFNVSPPTGPGFEYLLRSSTFNGPLGFSVSGVYDAGTNFQFTNQAKVGQTYKLHIFRLPTI